MKVMFASPGIVRRVDLPWSRRSDCKSAWSDRSTNRLATKHILRRWS